MRKRPDIVVVIIAILAVGIFVTGASRAFSDKSAPEISPFQQGTLVER